MSTYYEYQDVGVMIAHKLMNMEGWKVYGYHADESDSMTDYYSPAYWNGIAEKNGYILCVNVHVAREPEEIRKYNYDGKLADVSISEKINKLQQMTVERGASEAEAETARNMIVKLQAKQNMSNEKYVVVGIIPGHLANPPKCNWHIEKDGIIIAKGNGLLKYAKVDSYYRYSHYEEAMEKFKKDRKKYFEDWAQDQYMRGYYSTLEKALEVSKSRLEDMEADEKMINAFEAFINKIDTTCGGLLGEGDGVIYEKVTVTEYKKENKTIETTTGSLKPTETTEEMNADIENLTFEVSEDTDTRTNEKIYLVKVAEKLSREEYVKVNKYIKSIGGYYSKFKHAFLFRENPTELLNINKSETVPEGEEKQTETETETQQQEEAKQVINYNITEDTHTKTGVKIWIVSPDTELNKQDFAEVKRKLATLQGFYSSFKRGFIFKYDPTEKLKPA